MSFVACHEASITKPYIECINYHKCGDKEFNSCFFGEKEYWNQIIFVNDLEDFMTKGDTT